MNGDFIDWSDAAWHAAAATRYLSEAYAMQRAGLPLKNIPNMAMEELNGLANALNLELVPRKDEGGR
jgi:hypothetical protein